MRSLKNNEKTGFPVIFDATHSVQLPGGHGKQFPMVNMSLLKFSKSFNHSSISGYFYGNT